MKAFTLMPANSIADVVENILILECQDEANVVNLPLFANGMPTLLFQTQRGAINDQLNHLTLFGQTTRPDQIKIAGDFILIAYFFKPWILPELFGLAAKEMTNQPINLNILWSRQAHDLEDRLLNAVSVDMMVKILDDFIFSLNTKKKSDYREIDYATRLIASYPTKKILSTTQDKLAVTERTFQRMFEHTIGISPNQYRRVAQFNSAFQQLNKGGFKRLQDIGLCHHYADHSHFTRTFREFTNLTPKEYMAFGTADGE